MQERRLDDYWNVDGSRDLSDSRTGFTQFTLLEDQPPEGYLILVQVSLSLLFCKKDTLQDFSGLERDYRESS